MIEIIGYIGALVIGVVLGLIGGGGSIITVPIFVYLLAVHPVTATAYSLFVVGTTSLVGTIKNIKTGLVDFKTAIVFAIPAFIAVYSTRRYIMPKLPQVLWQNSWFTLDKNTAIMLFFALIMVLAALSMLKTKKQPATTVEKVNYNYPWIIIEGIVVGIITGIVGAGGGFLIIPALVLLAKLPMKKAVATSLLIIAIKSLIGFIGDMQTIIIDWPFLLLFTSLSIVGIFIGMYLNRFIAADKLKKSFAWFVLIMAIYIVYKELF